MNRPKLRTWQWIALGLLLFTGASWLVHRPDARARQLNGVIEAQASPHLKTYPYEFRVLRIESGVAVMSTPRNFDVPAFKMLGALYPDIDVKNPNDPAFIAAEKALAEAQSEARAIVLSQPGITGVRWELDKHWLSAHYIDVPDR
ncbi:MAG: hypothetical protein PHY45_07460 [Rhodocyclaceae bacterium]|nr:hypothetical protein [Rhodocyclaceae bacterium]